MGGVDKADMLKSRYEVDRKSKKWWHRIFFYFLDLCVVNAYIIYKSRSEGARLPLKQFRISVATGLIGAKNQTPKRGRPGCSKTPNKYKVTVLPKKAI
ncbi:hypothetical protein NQ314_008046 [Rhamnusium bicolor]|uniref:PiggyBac transposable element-derived protein domain-containing protein n=1 Tax=Rhamnusium bicolor TaxID=1586634 RepID=A0AAV8YG53_9CUCU|nr:hypothetical protein NQ314_008046 [Rhamnusium bicolor]